MNLEHISTNLRLTKNPLTKQIYSANNRPRLALIRLNCEFSVPKYILYDICERDRVSTHSKITVGCELSTVRSIGLIFVLELNSCLLVIAYPLLKEVSLSLQINHAHPFEGIRGVVELGRSQSEKKSVSNELYILSHESRIHTDQLYWQ